MSSDQGRVQFDDPFVMYASFVATPVPEPGTVGLVGMGLMVIAGAVRPRMC